MTHDVQRSLAYTAASAILFLLKCALFAVAILALHAGGYFIASSVVKFFFPEAQ